MTSELERELHELMMEATRVCKRELRWNPTGALGMIEQYGAAEAARRMVMLPDGSSGFARCWEEDRLGLTVESIIGDDPKFAPLFTEEVLSVAGQRLENARRNPPRRA